MQVDQEILERLERLEGERFRREAAEQAVLEAQDAPPKASSVTAERQRAQDLAVRARHDAVARRDRDFELELQRTAGTREKLRTQIAGIATDRESEVEQHVKIVEEHRRRLRDLDRKAEPLQRKLDELETAPLPPPPDYREANKVAVGATITGAFGTADMRRNAMRRLTEYRSLAARGDADAKAHVVRLQDYVAVLDDIDADLAA